jgi:predicted transcriptional regulator
MARNTAARKTPELETVLRVLASPTRRRILERLAAETHYPLQLSKELGVSQQAIMKHMKVLEDALIVRGVEEASDQGGPPRTAFKLTYGVSLSIDLGPAIFQTRMEVFDAGEKAEPRKAAPAPAGPREALAIRLSELSREASDLSREIEHLDRRRAELVSRKHRILNEAHGLIARMSDQYLARRILYFVTEAEEFSLSALSEHFNLRERVAQDMYRELLRAHLIPEYKVRRLR